MLLRLFRPPHAHGFTSMMSMLAYRLTLTSAALIGILLPVFTPLPVRDMLTVIIGIIMTGMIVSLLAELQEGMFLTVEYGRFHMGFGLLTIIIPLMVACMRVSSERLMILWGVLTIIWQTWSILLDVFEAWDKPPQPVHDHLHWTVC